MLHLFAQQIVALRKQITKLKGQKISEGDGNGNVDATSLTRHSEAKSSVSCTNDAKQFD